MIKRHLVVYSVILTDLSYNSTKSNEVNRLIISTLKNAIQSNQRQSNGKYPLSSLESNVKDDLFREQTARTYSIQQTEIMELKNPKPLFYRIRHKFTVFVTF